MSENILEVKDLSISFGTKRDRVEVVSGISINVPRNKIVCLVGESGCGKTVTALSVMGLLPIPPGSIDSGEVIFEGTNLLDLSEDELRDYRGNRISMIFQEPISSLNPVFTIGDQIGEAIKTHRSVSKSEERERVIELLELVEIPSPEIRINSYPHELSGGMCQRAMIAMALSCNPELLIADEPTTALDVTIQAGILDLILELRERIGMAVMLITHDLGVVSQIADEVYVIYGGKIMEKGSRYSIFNNPTNPYTIRLLNSIPSLEEKSARPTSFKENISSHRNSFTADHTASQTKDIDSKNLLVKIENLKKYYPIKGGLFSRMVNNMKAVDGVDLDIKRGTTLGLVGESGSGKTTLGKTIIRLINSTEGTIVYNGNDITELDSSGMRPLRKEIQMVFQNPYGSLNPRMNVGSLITEGMDIHNLYEKKERKEVAIDLLNKVGLSENSLSKYPHEFSGGQRQRIAIARALAVKPSFIVCDEPVSALDVTVQSQIVDLLQSLQDEFNLTYLFISHDLRVVKHISDVVAVMYLGKIVEIASSEEIYMNPVHPYTKTLISAIPDIKKIKR